MAIKSSRKQLLMDNLTMFFTFKIGFFGEKRKKAPDRSETLWAAPFGTWIRNSYD